MKRVFGSQEKLQSFAASWIPAFLAHKKRASALPKLRLLPEQRLGSGACVLALAGPLGAGKTTFVQGMAKGLGITRRPTSPTFMLARRYRISPHKRAASAYRWFWHFDCYRLSNARDLVELGFREIIADPRAIVAVEWADRVRRAIPKTAIWISFRHRKNGREVTIKKNIKAQNPNAK